MLTLLLLFSLVAFAVPSVSAANLYRRQNPVNTFIFSTAGNDDCKSITVSFFDAEKTLIESISGLKIDNKILTHSFNQSYVPSFVAFRAKCPSSNHNYRIFSITSYGITYDESTAMYLVGENGVRYLPGNKIPKKVGTSVVLLGDGKKSNGDWAEFKANAFTAKSVKGGGTLTVGIRNIKNSDFTIAKLPATSVVPDRMYVLPGFSSACDYLWLNWAPNSGSSITVNPNTITSNDMSKDPPISGTRVCEGSMGVSDSGILTTGTSVFKCSAEKCTSILNTGSAIPSDFPMVPMTESE